MAQREAEADEFYAELTPPEATADEALVMRQAFSSMLWSKQFYNYDVTRWLEGDPTQPTPPAERWTERNARWLHFNAFDIMSMPDKWEYPWFASWDLAFHCVTLAHVDPSFAKYQLNLVLREWFQHPNGGLPAYEWDFGDVNPPVQAWAALEVFSIDGARDLEFLERVFDKLLVNFTWWVNREDADGSNLFEGGFLGLDNIGPLDRSHLPVGGVARAVRRHRLDGLLRPQHGLHRRRAQPHRGPPVRERPRDQVPRALRHALRGDEQPGPVGRGGRLLLRPAPPARRRRVPLKVHSMVGIVPLLASLVLEEPMVARAHSLRQALQRDPGSPGPRRRGTPPPRASCAGSPGTAGCCSAWSASIGCCGS